MLFPTSPQRILLVDDADEVRCSVARMLQRRFDVTTAATAEEAMAVFDSAGPFAVVLTDYSLVGMNGLALLREIHRHDPETVGVLFTGMTGTDIAVSAVHEPGVFRFLAKPCGFEELVRAIEESFAHHASIVDRECEASELEFVRLALETFNGSLATRFQRQQRSLRRLQIFAGDLCACESLDAIAWLAAQATYEVLEGRGVHVQLWDDDSGAAVVEASAGPEMSAHLHLEDLRTVAGKIGEIVVDLGQSKGCALGESDRCLLASIAASTAVAVHHELRSRERDEAQHATILALARLAERRDNDTGKHLERVAGYCRLIATGMRENGLHTELIRPGWLRDLERSSALHDIGKVGIPDAVLLKPGKLNAEEWRVMKTHAEIGAETLSSLIDLSGSQRFLTMGRDIAWCHHEKWDGSGYPRGLRGADIPIAARILSLADVYDALTSLRPYKKPWTHQAALDWIRAGSGVHFDPQAVAALVTQADAADRLRARLMDVEPDLDEHASPVAA